LLQGLQLLSAVGKFPERRKPTPLADAVHSALANLQHKVDSTDATITSDELPAVNCDRFEMTQVFENLFDNSLKFTAEGKPAHVHVSAQRDRRFWHIIVADDGIGMGSEYLNRIFDLFQRLNPRNEYPGTGIGLTICKKIVEVHGGRIWAESEVGVGTSIHFTLPA
jgi:signal transduction histidine kinase